MAISDLQLSTGSSTSGPLAVLENTKSKLSPLQYPSDLGTNANRLHYVKFLVKQIQPTSVTGSVGEINATNIVAAGEKQGKQIFNSFSELNFNPPTTGIVDVISLYMPDTLTASYNASYDELNLTSDLGKGVMALQAINSVEKYAGNKNSGAARSVDAIVAAALGIGVSTVANLANAGGSAITDVVIQSQGFAINPQLQMIYRGLDFRQFQLSFTFTPASRKEAEDVNKILATFKYHFSPELVKLSDAASGMFFVPPSLFNVEFMFGPEENQYLPRYGDCVLRDIDINYAPNGFATHNDGSPIQTQMTLTFQEIEIVTKEKIKNGYNATSTTQLGSAPGKTAGLR